MIEFKEGAVCYANSSQWFICDNVDIALNCKDFQLNEPKSGYYIPKSELDTEEKYNQAVEEFGLFGYRLSDWTERYEQLTFKHKLTISAGEVISSTCDEGVEFKFDQLMAIGELKRKINERDWKAIESKALSDLPIFKAYENKPAKKRKSKEAYRILE